MAKRLIRPATISLITALVIVGVAIVSAGGDPLVLARLGTMYSQGDAAGSEGYDGQFVYYIALQPQPQAVSAKLDVPAYRYQRILMPLLGRLLALGDPQRIAWALPLINILALALGTWAVEHLLAGFGVSRWYALIYGFWAGFTLALVTDLPEPLAYGLVAVGVLALERHRPWVGWLLLALAGFAKETSLVFTFALLGVYLYHKRWQEATGLALVAGLPFLIFQLWLHTQFGQFGVGSGGAMATPFEIVPYMGLLRIASYDLVYLLAMLVVFGPTVVLPSAWGVWKAVQISWDNEVTWQAAALFLNALVIIFAPFSTFRETGGIIRLASSLVLAVLLFAGRYRMGRVLNYSAFWLVLNVFLLK